MTPKAEAPTVVSTSQLTGMTMMEAQEIVGAMIQVATYGILRETSLVRTLVLNLAQSDQDPAGPVEPQAVSTEVAVE